MKLQSINKILRFLGVLLVVTTEDNTVTTLDLVSTQQWEERVEETKKKDPQWTE